MALHTVRRLIFSALLAAPVVAPRASAQPLPGRIDTPGPWAPVPAASRPTDVPVTGREGGPGPEALDSLELAAALLEVERAEIDASATSLLQRLTPRVTLSASFGAGEVVFRDPDSDALTILPRDSYRITFSLGLDQLFRSPDHDRALARLKMARLDAARTRIQISQRASMRTTDENVTRQELALLSDELGLVRQLVAYNEMLFAEGKAEFDILARAKLHLLNLSRTIAQVSQRLVRPD